MKLVIFDYFVIICYGALILFIGFIIARNKEKGSSGAVQFILAGRRLSLPLFVATLVSTWYGNILGVGEFVYTNGISAWVCWGLPYYIAAVIFALYFAKKIRNLNVTTIAEQVSRKFGNRAGFLASVIVLLITIPAPYILMTGVILQIFFGWDLWICIVLGSVLSTAYIFTGGFKADVFANVAQFLLMYIGFAVLLIFTVLKFGTYGVLSGNLPNSHLTLAGNHSWQFIASWYIIALQTFIDPGFHQRCSAAKTPKIASRGILISVILWGVFDFFTLTTGLYAKAFFSLKQPMMAYISLADSVLPAVWKGLFIAAMLAPIMSALNGYAFVSGATIGQDIIPRILGKRQDDKSITFYLRIGILITSLVGIIMALALPSPVELIYKTASIAVPGLLLPMLLTYFDKIKITEKKFLILMLASAGASGLWTIASYLSSHYEFFNYQIFTQFEPLVPGLLVSVILSMIFVKRGIGNSLN
ncbi:MAG: hypothetical protein HW421_2348 [Ignavibacteria bacterium]|nr:hypothetical protein [Ignavibacteria bacterium]